MIDAFLVLGLTAAAIGTIAVGLRFQSWSLSAFGPALLLVLGGVVLTEGIGSTVETSIVPASSFENVSIENATAAGARGKWLQTFGMPRIRTILFCENVGALEDATVVTEGTTAELTNASGNGYTISTLTCTANTVLTTLDTSGTHSFIRARVSAMTGTVNVTVSFILSADTAASSKEFHTMRVPASINTAFGLLLALAGLGVFLSMSSLYWQRAFAGVFQRGKRG